MTVTVSMTEGFCHRFLVEHNAALLKSDPVSHACNLLQSVLLFMYTIPVSKFLGGKMKKTNLSVNKTVRVELTAAEVKTLIAIKAGGKKAVSAEVCLNVDGSATVELVLEKAAQV